MPIEGLKFEKYNPDSDLPIFKITGFSGRPHPKLTLKLHERNELRGIGRSLKRHGVVSAFTSGTFDLIHPGHFRYLELARDLGDTLTVGLNSNRSVKKYKDQKRPILDEKIRAEMLAGLSCVDRITIYDEVNAARVIKALRPDCYLCVEDHWHEEGRLHEKPEVVAMMEVGGKVFISPRQDPKISTTDILKKVERAAIQDAIKEMLDAMKDGPIDPDMLASVLEEALVSATFTNLREALSDARAKSNGSYNGHANKSRPRRLRTL